MKRFFLEIWKFRNLVWALVLRHLNTRYRGSLFGFLWSFLNPLCLILVYSLVFKYYIRSAGIENYTLFLFAGLLPWIWFSTGLIEATGSISYGGHLITKAMFPSHVLPVVSVLTNLANFLFALPLLLGYMLITQTPLSLALVALPAIVLVQLVFLTGIGLFMSALNVYYRDIQHILGNLLTLAFFLTPILYPVDQVPEQFRFTLHANPMACFSQMYQEIFVKGQFPDAELFGIAVGCALGALFIGCAVFNRLRDEFAELV